MLGIIQTIFSSHFSKDRHPYDPDKSIQHFCPDVHPHEVFFVFILLKKIANAFGYRATKKYIDLLLVDDVFILIIIF